MSKRVPRTPAHFSRFRLATSAAVLLVLLASLSSRSPLRASTEPPQRDPQAATALAPSALAQIQELAAEKASRTPTQQKIDSQLIYATRTARGEAITAGVQTLATDVPQTADARFIVDVTAYVDDGLLAQMRGLGAEVLSSSVDYHAVRLALPPNAVEPVAALNGVLFVQPKQESTTNPFVAPRDRRVARSGAGGDPRLRPGFDRAGLERFITSQVADQGSQTNFITGVGSKFSEGDLTHRAYAARGAFHTTGAGIKIGVISNGVRSLAASQALGDLGPVAVLGPPDPCAASPTTCDEGTAMLEIVHDLAPDAQLYFASANVSITDFAQKIRDLQAAGCSVIVDDVAYFVESPFQDGQTPAVVSTTNGGVVIQAVKDVAALGVLYFSSAANSGNLDSVTSGTWEGNFLDGGTAAGILAGAGQLHNFGTVGAPQTFDAVSVAGTAPISLAWSDPLGGSANDYDLYKLNSAGTSVTAASTNLQTGTQDPFEQINAATAGERIVIAKFSGAVRFLHLSTNRARLSIATAGETHGHAATSAPNSFGVAAVDAGAASPNPFTAANVVETFSSDGPRRIFFNGDGSALTPGNFSATGGQVLQKPDFTAADGVSVTGVGGFGSPFFGTSAAAPHAAAIAALIRSAKPSLTPAQIRTALVSSAIDIGTAGVDRDSGAGIIMAYQALQAAGVVGTAFLADTAVTAVESPGNGNGAINVGEGAQMSVTLTNLGTVIATGISATLTTSTPGVTVTLPGVSAYSNLAAGAAGANTTPFRFTVASNASCPMTINFTLTVTSAGGVSSVLPIQVTTGLLINVTTTLDGTAPSLLSGVTVATGQQTGRLSRSGVVATCAAPKANPGLTTAVGSRQFDSFAFNSCPENTGSCASVVLTAANGINLYTAAYSPSFSPAAPATSFLADPGSSGPSQAYSFLIPSGAGQSATVVVHDIAVTPASNSPYTLTVTGVCGGLCATPNQVPIARAHDVSVVAGAGGTAAASINNGSSDGDGDPLTITQFPAGPYPVGVNSVLLTVVDPKGATGQATANVTVTATPPTIAITSPTAASTFSVPAGTTAIDLAGTAAGINGVSQVTWTNNRGGSGTATGTTSWSISALPLQPGANLITVTARNAFSLTTAATLTVTVPPTMALVLPVINFGVVNSGGTLSPATPTQTLTLTQNGPATVTWTVSVNQPWLSVTPSSGSGGGILTVTIVNPPAPNQLPAIGSLSGTITVNTTGAANSPSAGVNLTLLQNPQLTTPIGTMETPSDGQGGVTGAIAVTGWAIDDIGVTRVEVVRDPVSGEGAAQIFIGDAVFVTGARPDIAALFPTKPFKDQAGWGYMLLTNFLPNHGNGTFRLSAYASDVDGHRVLIGSKTIVCTNATATAPFGAIDTPTQGGSVSGTFINFGWALAGQPTGRFIPFDGSTIQVFIDSASIGTVDSYNHARSDIQAAFPGYVNTDGAIGVKVLDSTTLANGVHTIAWLVTDNLGSAEGVGSRFFSVSNNSLIAAVDVAPPIALAQTTTASVTAAAPGEPSGSTDEVTLRRGFDDTAAVAPLPEGTDGLRVLRVAPLERITLTLPPSSGSYRGFTLVGDREAALPIGSHFDPATGVFIWMPGPGFGGTHKLAFVVNTPTGEQRIRIDVQIAR